MRKLTFNEYRRVPRDSETLRRSIIRKLRGRYVERPHDFISGDSFKDRADEELRESSWRELLFNAYENPSESKVFFLPGAPKSSISFDMIEQVLREKSWEFPNISLIMHNGDLFPHHAKVEEVSYRFKSIYSVNWLGNSPKVFPLPIGLENEGYLVNGVLSDYLTMSTRKVQFSERKYDFLACFSIHTNPSERTDALFHAKKLKNALIVDSPITPRQYRELLLNCKFVISPPGNGVDCHRTWESQFLGAVPVVKRSFWPFKDHKLPVKVIGDWDELKEVTSGSVDYFDTSLDKLKLNYWLN